MINKSFEWIWKKQVKIMKKEDSKISEVRKRLDKWVNKYLWGLVLNMIIINIILESSHIPPIIENIALVDLAIMTIIVLFGSIIKIKDIKTYINKKEFFKTAITHTLLLTSTSCIIAIVVGKVLQQLFIAQIILFSAYVCSLTLTWNYYALFANNKMINTLNSILFGAFTLLSMIYSFTSDVFAFGNNFYMQILFFPLLFCYAVSTLLMALKAEWIKNHNNGQDISLKMQYILLIQEEVNQKHLFDLHLTCNKDESYLKDMYEIYRHSQNNTDLAHQIKTYKNNH